jgi:hypothetical protein
MSDGGIQKGHTFWATIRIKGRDVAAGEALSKEELKNVMNSIRQLLNSVKGNVVQSVQADSDENLKLSKNEE